MSKKQYQFPPMIIVAYIALITACSIVISILIVTMADHISKGLLLLTVALTLLGVGEILNHPQETILPAGQNGDPNSPRYHRRRNSCGLGNLCDIGSLLFLCMTLSALFFSH